jgi:DNA end-binding protein Ku
MSTMRFADEVVPRSEIEGLPRRGSKPDPKALTMAMQIVDGLTGEWRPQNYHDTFAEELRKRIKAKDAGKKVVEAKPATDGKVLDLMAALEASVESAKGRRTAARRAAPAKRTRKKAS